MGATEVVCSFCYLVLSQEPNYVLFCYNFFCITASLLIYVIVILSMATLPYRFPKMMILIR